MPKERPLSDRRRTPQKVRGEVIAQEAVSMTGDLLKREDVPTHLQPLKEEAEVSIVATEIMKQKRVLGDRAIVTMAHSATGAVLDVNDGETEANEILDAQPQRASQRERASKAIEEISGITYRAIQDGLEVSADIVNDIVENDPRKHKVADTTITIEDLTPKERFTGRVRRKK